MGRWRRGDELERELRSHRPEPRRELVDDIAGRIVGRPGRTGFRMRVGVAVALTAGMLTALGAFGGLSYAADGVGHAVYSAVHVVVPTKASQPSIAMTSAQAQYRITVCFHGFTLEVDSHFVRLLEALGAKPGACKPPPHHRGHRGHHFFGVFKPSTKKAVMCFEGKNTVVAKVEESDLTKLHFKRGYCKTR
jgi:hypothetical protein